MNKIRRKRLQIAINFQEQVINILDEVKNDEQKSYDSLPNSLRRSDSGALMNNNIFDLETLSETCDGVIDDLKDL